ncbi:MAG: cupin domain-containing protein [Haliangiales bacterium]
MSDSDKGSAKRPAPTRLGKRELIESLQLEPHVEGGFFRRTFQADHRATVGSDSSSDDDGQRYLLTSIFYLLTEDSRVGHWHRNRSDIIHYFHLGEPIEYALIHPDGRLETAVMGPDPTRGQRLQLAVLGGVWKASQLRRGEYGLISEAVAPGFDYRDMELGERAALTAQFPQHRALIEAYTRG